MNLIARIRALFVKPALDLADAASDAAWSVFATVLDGLVEANDLYATAVEKLDDEVIEAYAWAADLEEERDSAIGAIGVNARRIDKIRELVG